jgi:predicted DCC family thiol-disulfide oxidoreductase YuxK
MTQPLITDPNGIMKNQIEHPVIVFDGVCNLCSRSVVFVIKRDPGRIFRFAALQTDAGRQLLLRYGLNPQSMTTLALIENGRIYHRSGAVLHITRNLRGIWPILYVLIIIPSFLRDPVYDWIARNRYKWFGKKDECFVPSEQDMNRFIL